MSRNVFPFIPQTHPAMGAHPPSHTAGVGFSRYAVPTAAAELRTAADANVPKAAIASFIGLLFLMGMLFVSFTGTRYGRL